MLREKFYIEYGDNDLFRLVKQDDTAAFTELYNRYWEKLFAIAYNRLKETQAAEDIVHDVFASLWANRQKVKINSLENYLATAAKYLVLGKIKKIHRERKFADDTSHQTPVIDFPVETSFHNKRILELVKTEVERLPEKCRLIFKYSRNEGMPVKMIARKLDISPKTVENQLNKALRQLKQVTNSLLSIF